MSKVTTGQKTAIKLTLQPLPVAVVETAASAVASCSPAITDLFWFSDSTGQFDQTAEAAGLATDGNPTLNVARLLGEICDLPVTWTETWTPTDSGDTGSDPGYLEDGSELVVYQLSTTRPGTLEVTAECNGESFGPILLTVLAVPASGDPDWIQIFGPDNWEPAGSPSASFSWDGTKWTVPFLATGAAILSAKGSWPTGFSPKRCRLTLGLASGTASESGHWIIALFNNSMTEIGEVSVQWLDIGTVYQIEVPIRLAAGKTVYLLIFSPWEAVDTCYIFNIEFHL